MTDDRSAPLPERVGPYEIKRLIGQGGMAMVMLAESPSGERVALKWLDRSSASLNARFQREVATLRRLHHPNVVRVIDDGVERGRPYMVMELVEGPDLRVYATKLRERPAEERYREVCRVGASLCDALEAVHALGLIHRDVKPANILLDRRGAPRLADFGVVKDTEEPDHTALGAIVGTTGYASPEQLRGEEIDHRADLYSLGCTLYFLLTGERPYPNRERKEVLRSHLAAPIPHPSALDPQVPPALESAIMRLLAKSRDDRYPSAAAARAALTLGVGWRPPPPLAGRSRYVEAVGAVLDRVAQGQGRVLQLLGPKGSGRSWLLDVTEDLAARRGVPVVIARDEATLEASVARLRGGEALCVATRLPTLPDGAGLVETLRLEPLSIAEVRRSVVSIAPGTLDAHLVSERLYRATGGHPAWLLPLMESQVSGDRLSLPDPCPTPTRLAEALDALPYETLEVLGAVCLLGGDAPVSLIEEVAQIPADELLAALEAEALLTRQAGAWTPTGELIRDGAQARLPDPDAVRLRAERARAREAQAELGGLTDPAAAFLVEAEAIEALSLSGQPERAALEAEALVARARGARQRGVEARLTRAWGQALLDSGRARLAESRFADAVALARALDQPTERRAAHILRAVATLDARPGNPTAAAVALDRLHRALTLLDGADPEGFVALGFAARAEAAAILGDRAGAGRAVLAATAELCRVSGPMLSRVQLRLARAAMALDDRAVALPLAQTVEDRCCGLGLGLLADAAGQLARSAERQRGG
ncbi:serine/threonine protein kinase [Myxococcota bacterium]|nr:serine/threonine protein kinase [Myxococcota bacterium]